MDLQLTIDGLILSDDETVDEYIEKIRKITNSSYEIIYEILYEELITDELPK